MTLPILLSSINRRYELHQKQVGAVVAMSPTVPCCKAISSLNLTHCKDISFVNQLSFPEVICKIIRFVYFITLNCLEGKKGV